MADKEKKNKKKEKLVADVDDAETADSNTSYFLCYMTTLFALVKYNISDSYHSMATFCYILAVIVEFILI